MKATRARVIADVRSWRVLVRGMLKPALMLLLTGAKTATEPLTELEHGQPPGSRALG